MVIESSKEQTRNSGTCNVVNRTIFTRDNLEVLRGINSGSIDLVYLDPPFNSNKNYSAPIGSKAATATQSKATGPWSTCVYV